MSQLIFNFYIRFFSTWPKYIKIWFRFVPAYWRMQGLRTLLNSLEGCVHCTLLLLLDSLLWEGTFVPTYWRTQGSKPLDRAYGPVQSFEYAAEHSNSFMFCMQKISFWEVQELECCARRAQNFLRLKYLGHRNRKNGKVEKKRKRKTKYTLEEL